ncbi:hypothetical protein TWF281_005295 [Arthrobotrys megalospora]
MSTAFGATAGHCVQTGRWLAVVVRDGDAGRSFGMRLCSTANFLKGRKMRLSELQHLKQHIHRKTGNPETPQQTHATGLTCAPEGTLLNAGADFKFGPARDPHEPQRQRGVWELCLVLDSSSGLVIRRIGRELVGSS